MDKALSAMLVCPSRRAAGLPHTRVQRGLHSRQRESGHQARPPARMPPLLDHGTTGHVEPSVTTDYCRQQGDALPTLSIATRVMGFLKKKRTVFSGP